MSEQSKALTEKELHRSVHPFLFTILILPMGISFGYVSITFAYLLSQAGVSVDKIAALIAVSYLPHIFKFAWAPLVDTTLSFKKWYRLASIISSLSILAFGFFPMQESSLPALTIIVIIFQFAITFLCMSTEGLMAYDVKDESKGRSGGFFQAGNLGGAGLGGGLGLILAQRLPASWMVNVVLGIICLLCMIALIYFKDPTIGIRVEKIKETYKNLLQDVWLTLKSKKGILSMLLCFLTLGTGAASNLWASVAKDWHASADVVAIATGVVGGLFSALGCIVGGWICDRMNRRTAYLLFGFISAACAVGMAYSPRTQIMFITWTSLYAIALGLCYAGFTAFTLEAIGKGAAATKYNLFAALSNSPTYLMTYIVGLAYARGGGTAMLNIEAAFAVGAIILFIVLQKLIFYRKNKLEFIAALK